MGMKEEVEKRGKKGEGKKMGRKREKKSGRMTEVIKYAAIYYSTCIDEFSLSSSLSGILLNFSNSLLLFSLSFLRKRERG